MVYGKETITGHIKNLSYNLLIFNQRVSSSRDEGWEMSARGWDTIGHGREMHGDKRRQNSFLFSFYLLKSNDYAVGIQQTNGANVW